MKTWRNGAGASVVKQVIDDNFKTLETQLSQLTYSKSFTADDWTDNKITVPYANHLISSPIVEAFVKKENVYVLMYGDVSIDAFHNVVLSCDTPFDGKVVIK